MMKKVWSFLLVALFVIPFVGAVTVHLSEDSPTKQVTIDNDDYDFELISADESSAVVKISNEAGLSEQKDVEEGASKRIVGLNVKVVSANNTNGTYGAELDVSVYSISSSKKISFNSDEKLKEKIKYGGKVYELELFSASDDSATIKVVNEDGETKLKEILENSVGDIFELEIKVTFADDSLGRILADIEVTADEIIVPVQCSDSDEGEEYFVKGTTAKGNETHVDSCDGDVLEEGYCEDNVVKAKTFECEFGCEEGVCLEEVEEEVPEVPLCAGCLVGEVCFATGDFNETGYCSDDGSFSELKEKGSVCVEGFECETGICSEDGECKKLGFFKRLGNWFKGIFS